MALHLETLQSEPIRPTPSQTFQATQFSLFESKDSALATESEVEPQLEPKWKHPSASADLLSLPDGQSTTAISYP
jgi:hypothetical protein